MDMTASSWALVGQVLVLARVLAKASQQVAKGLATHGRACWLLISRAGAPVGAAPLQQAWSVVL